LLRNPGGAALGRIDAGCRSVIADAENARVGARARTEMSKDELIIQLVKIALGVLIAGYFFWWSLEVLKRLPPVH
jgi:hypothetical protein